MGREGETGVEGKSLLNRMPIRCWGRKGDTRVYNQKLGRSSYKVCVHQLAEEGTGLDEGSSLLARTSYKVFVVQGAEKVKAAQAEAEALKRETALAAAALEGRTQALARQEAAAAEAKALLAVRTKELDNREVEPC